MSPKTFSIRTLGCRINFYESESVGELLLSRGFVPAQKGMSADLTLIHSCAVTAQAERKGRALVLRALSEREPGQKVCLFGCLGEKRREELYLRFPELDLVWGTYAPEALADACAALWDESERPVIPRPGRAYDTPPIAAWYSPRAFVKIQDGCDSFCTYCIIPYLRGRSRGRPEEEIVAEVADLARRGAREIVLSGIETADYGAENLLHLAEKIAAFPEILRIRFGSLKPTLFTRDFCRGLRENRKIMPHFHLSVQSGASPVLSAMRRDYDRETLYGCVEELRGAIPHAALSADLICGFPGETDADFEDSVSFVKDARLLHAHIFPYSAREGTRAAAFPGQIPVEERRRRAAALGWVAETVAGEEKARLLPLEKAILVERFSGGSSRGHSEHFLELALPRTREDRVGELKEIGEQK